MGPHARYLFGIGLFLALLLYVLNRFWGILVIADKVVLHTVLFLGMWAIVGVLLLFARFVERGPYLLWPEQKRTWTFHALSLLGIFGITVVFGIVNKLIGGVPDAAQAAKDAAYWDAHPWLFAFMGLTAGGTEELMMRGYLQPRLEALTRSPWLAIVLSSAVFALAHYTNSPPPKLLILFLSGITFAWHYHRYRSILALIVAHVLIDVVSL